MIVQQMPNHRISNFLKAIIAIPMLATTTVKLVVVGGFAVGKTTLIRRMFNRSMDADAGPSIANSWDHATVVVDGAPVTFSVWDTAGQESYRTMVPLAFRGAEIALLVFAIDSPPSFLELPQWRALLSEKADCLKAVILVGNKADRRGGAADPVPLSQAAGAEADLECAAYVETSAVTGEGIAELGRRIVESAALPPRVSQQPRAPLPSEAPPRCC